MSKPCSRRGFAFVLLLAAVACYLLVQETVVLKTPPTSDDTQRFSPSRRPALKPLATENDGPVPPQNMFVWNEKEEEAKPKDRSETERGSSSDAHTSNRDKLPPSTSASEKTAPRTPKTSKDTPGIVWLASYPNSGTSYTMTMVERSTNLSTATNYGIEIATQDKDDSVPLHKKHPEGPFWEGLSGKRGTTIRDLPQTLVLTKTHCGGRCVNCPASEYVVNTDSFLQACQKTSGYHTVSGTQGVRFYGQIDTERIHGVIHLIRSPFTNTVARYHLERRHLVQKNPMLENQLPNNATGFQKWCHYLDESYSDEESQVIAEEIVDIMKDVPCRAEFFKYAQWHSRLMEVLPQLSETLTVHYEDYELRFNETVDNIMGFLTQEVVRPIRPFRTLPTYADHYSDRQRRAAKQLVEAVASPEAWNLVQRYF